MGRVNRGKWFLSGFIIGVLVLAGGALLMPEKVTGAAAWVASITSPSKVKEHTGVAPAKELPLVEMDIVGVQVSPTSRLPIVILKEKNAERYLVMGIGIAEANAIRMRLEEVKTPRPLTHDLMSSVIKTLGARVNSVIINDFQEDTFYARILLNTDGKGKEVDSRPSDAIALALGVKAPIFAAESVLDRAGIPLKYEGQGQTLKSGEQSLPASSGI